MTGGKDITWSNITLGDLLTGLASTPLWVLALYFGIVVACYALAPIIAEPIDRWLTRQERERRRRERERRSRPEKMSGREFRRQARENYRARIEGRS